MKEIEGFEGYYISSEGYVFSKKRNIILKGSMTKKNGYIQVYLLKNKIIHRFLIHRLVAIYFLDNPYHKKEVNHIDGNKLNNNISNLEWVTKQENMSHALKKGLFRPKEHWTDEMKKKVIKSRINTYKNTPCEKRGRSILNRQQVIEIRKRFDNGEGSLSISKDYPVGRVSCARVGKRETYSDVI
jgi:hypothetical protein